MTKYEAAKAYIETYAYWQSLWQWRDLFKIGIHCESTDLLKTAREKIFERTAKTLTPELNKKYVEAVALIDAFNVDFNAASRQSRRDMDRIHEQMLETCFPKDPKDHYTVYDHYTAKTIAFTMEGHRYVSGTLGTEEGGKKTVFGYFDFKSPDIRATHCRYSINEDDEVFFTTEEDIY